MIYILDFQELQGSLICSNYQSVLREEFTIFNKPEGG